MTNRLAIALALSFIASRGEAATKPQTTDYCLVDAVQASTGPGSDAALGNFIMKARLTLKGAHYSLSVWNVMPDNPQILSFDADGTYQPTGLTHIRFIDSWDNHGIGSFSASRSEMRINIDQAKVAAGGENIGRNYGSYKLSSRKCKWTAPG